MARRTLYRDGALADGRSAELRLGVSVLVEDGRVAWIRPSDDEPDPGPAVDLEVVDAGGTAFVPGMVDSHSHLTLPGGSHWIERGSDPPEQLLRVAEHNGELMSRAGVRWARDVGSPPGPDDEGTRRALSLGVRDGWRGRTNRPYVRAAGTWVAKAGYLPALTVEASDAGELRAAAGRQLDDGADFVKLMLDGPEPGVAPWTAEEVRPVVEDVHARGAKVTAHATYFACTQVCAEAGVDCIEHGFELDEDTARLMAERGVALSSTLAVMKSWLTFGRTTTLPRFVGEDSERRIRDRLAAAQEGVRNAHRAGVLIAAGTDFGGGSLRANQLAWEVEALVEAGLEPWEAVAAATWHGGRVLGEPSAGVIAEGGPPDFFLVHGDPLSNPSALWRVWRVAWQG
jgi:imidazolonepropionase-like amidohydrolase